jgi:CheY-like chemotaxis protein
MNGSSPSPPALAAPSRALRVLVVDDLVDAAESLARLLRFDQHEVRTAFRAAEALAVANEQQPDVVLLDLGLPDLDGYRLAEQLRQGAGCRAVTIIAITGRTLPRDRERAAAAGIDHYLLKPVRIGELQAVLGQHVAGYVAR